MENNKILIGIQFTDIEKNEIKQDYIELYVLRDITMRQLFHGITYGLEKFSEENNIYSDVYKRCNEIFDKVIEEDKKDKERGLEYCPHIMVTAFNDENTNGMIEVENRTVLRRDALDKPICDLGLITSSRIIFDATGNYNKSMGKIDTSNIVEAFNRCHSKKIIFPEYNISTRQLYRFDEEAIDIIEPTEPPQKSNNNLFFLLLPSLVSFGILMLSRVWLMDGNNNSMIILSIVMGMTAFFSTIITWISQKMEYKKNLQDWREQYQNYIDSVLARIQKRQTRDAFKLNELYPDMLSLINRDEKGIYSLNENLYSRSPHDSDFLTFRLGISDNVENVFSIKGEKKEIVFSEAFFDIETDNSGTDRLKIFLRNELKKKGDGKKENLCKLPSVITSRYKYMKNAPLLYSLKNKRALGIVDRESGYSEDFILRMIFELCYYHSPEDLQFVIFFDKKNQNTTEFNQWEYIQNEMNMYKFMPHFRGLFEDKSQFVFDMDSANLVLSSLMTMMGKRKNIVSEESTEISSPHIVFIVFNDYGLKEHAFAEFLPKVSEKTEKDYNSLGLTFVFSTKYKEYLPAFCDDIVCLGNEMNTITPHDDINMQKQFFYENEMAHILKNLESDTETYSKYSKKVHFAFAFMSSIYYAQIAQNGKVPSTVSAFEILKQNNESSEEIIARNWGFSGIRICSDVTESLKVPIGKKETGFAYLDLHEKGDGPHMLVAGTTGSGKTETIITFLLGLCMQFRPDELNLLLVDMKGGGFTKRIGHLPHVVGKVTDVEGDENGTGAEYMLGRFLFAMKSEIKRRKILFNEMYVDSIDGYITACKDIEYHIQKKRISKNDADRVRKIAAEESLSHLILVVDEFTELKRFSDENGEFDFIKEITTIARVGRSLGFHIILISQNIEGAITDDIRVNSKARLCLKVATRQASKEMIGTELAASPQMPGNGRAYLLIGTGSKFEYFQSGYSGASIESKEIPIEIILASKCGAYSTFYRSDKDNREQESKLNKKTQLEDITDAICNVYEKEKEDIVKPHIVFREPLPAYISVDKDSNVVDKKGKAVNIYKARNENDLEIATGIYDAPQIQQQPICYLNPLKSNIAIFGGPMTGKTTFIKNFLVRVHENREFTSKENIYILDFGGNMGEYSQLESVCACFDNSNEENIKRVFKTLEHRMDENTKILKSNNFYSLYTKDPSQCPKHLILIIENLNAFLTDERYSAYQDRLMKLCRDGVSKGLSVIVTANDITGTGRLMTNFGQKIAFEMPVDSYFEIFNSKVSKPMKLPGRGLINIDSSIYEIQCFVPFPNNEDSNLQSLIKESCVNRNENKMLAFDGALTFDNILDFNPKVFEMREKDDILVGLDYYEHKPIYLNVDKSRSIAIYGKRKFGKTNLLEILINGILEQDKEARFVYLDDGRKELEGFKNTGVDSVYLDSIDEFKEYLVTNGYGGWKLLLSNGKTVSGTLGETPYTIFVLQSKSLYLDHRLLTTCFPEMISNAERRKYLFIFSDVKNISNPELRVSFNNYISTVFLLDDIGEFVANRGSTTVLGEMDARELKEEYGKCSCGDGYYYDVEASKDIEKLKFIKI